MGTLADVYIRVVGDDSSAQRTIKKVTGQVEELGRKKADFKITANTRQADAQIRALESTLDGLQKKRVQIPIKASRIDGDIAVINRQLDELRKTRVDVPVELTGKIDEKIAATKKKLEELAARPYQVKPELREKINGQIQELTEKLRRLEANRVEVRIAASIPTKQIAALETKLASLERRKISIPVQLTRAEAEIASVEAQLAALGSQEVNIKVKFDTSQLSQASRGVSSASRGFAGLLALPALASGAGLAVGGIASLAAGLVALTSAAAPAVGALVALPGAAIAAGQGAGVAAVAFLGVGDALKAMTASDTASSTTAKTNAAARAAAAESVRSAQVGLANAVRAQQRTEASGAKQVQAAVQAVADARVKAGQQVTAAEATLASAQRGVISAQAALNVARKTEIDTLEQLHFSLADAANSEEDATIGLLRAQERLTAAQRAGSGSSKLDLREARASVADAKQRLIEVKDQHQDIVKQVAAADKAGIEGAATVVAARGKVTEAQRAELKAAQAVQRARVDGSKQIAKAQVAEVDAQLQAAQANQDAARTTAEAQHQVTIAQQQAGLAMEKQSAQAAGLAAALAKISPKARDFAKYLHSDLIPALRGLQFKIQDTFFPPFETAVKTVSGLLPIFTKGLAGTAGILGDLAVAGAKLVTSGPWKKDFATLMDGNNRVLATFGRAVLPIAQILMDIAVAALPLTERFAKFVEKAALVTSAFISAKRESGGLAGFFKTAGDVAAILGDILGNIVGAFLNIGKAGSDAGKGLLDSFDKATAKFKDLTGAASGQNLLKKFFDNAADSTREAGKLFNDIVLALINLGANKGVAKLIGQIRTQLLPALVSLVGSLSGDFGSKVVDLFSNLAGVVERLTAHGGALSAFVGTLSGMAGAVKDVLNSPLGPVVTTLLKLVGIAAAVGLVLSPIVGLFGALAGVIVPVAGFLATTVFGFSGVGAALAALLGPVGLVIAAVVAVGAGLIYAWKHSETFRDAVKGLGRAIGNGLHPIVVALGDFFRDHLKPGFDKLVAAFKEASPGLLKLAKVVGLVLGGFVVLAAKILGFVIPILIKLAGPIFDAVIEVIVGMIKVLGKLSSVVATVIKFVVKVFLEMVGALVTGAAKAFGWIPGLGGKLKGAAEAFNRFKDDVNKKLDAINDKTVHVGVKLSKEAEGAIKAFGKNNVVLHQGELVGVRVKGGIIRAYAQGGPIHGAGGPTEDRVPLLGSNGEHMVTAREVHGAGGHRAVAATRAMWRAAGGGQFAVATDFPGGAAVDRQARSIRELRDLAGSRAMIAMQAKVAVAAANANRLGLGSADPTGKYTFPLPRGSYSVGMPLNGYPGHTGQDFPVPIGTPVFAPYPGLFHPRALGNRSYGNMIDLRAGNMQFIGGHNSRFARPGGYVRAGEILAYSGSTGNSTGPHEHVEFRRNNQVIDPRSVLSFDKGGLLYPGQVGGNTSGKPERVLTGRQTETWDRALPVLERIAANGGGRAVNNYITVDKRRTAIEIGRVTNNALDHGWAGG